jgi:hypothetical protein
MQNSLFELDFRAGFFQFGFGSFRIVFGNLLFNRFRSAVNNGFGFGKAETVSSRTALMTLIFSAPTSARITSNSVCSSAAAAAPPSTGAATQQRLRRIPRTLPRRL